MDTGGLCFDALRLAMEVLLLLLLLLAGRSLRIGGGEVFVRA